MKKYSILFLLIIILAKVIYLLFEIDYNGSLLDIVSKPKVDKEELESLELYGHKLSSIGLTLLVIPFLYLVYNFIVKNKIFFLYGADKSYNQRATFLSCFIVILLMTSSLVYSFSLFIFT